MSHDWHTLQPAFLQNRSMAITVASWVFGVNGHSQVNPFSFRGVLGFWGYYFTVCTLYILLCFSDQIQTGSNRSNSIRGLFRAARSQDPKALRWGQDKGNPLSLQRLLEKKLQSSSCTRLHAIAFLHENGTMARAMRWAVDNVEETTRVSKLDENWSPGILDIRPSDASAASSHERFSEWRLQTADKMCSPWS